MLDLAMHYGEGPIVLKDISKRQTISEKYLWHLINPLKVAGLISSTGGPHGGYVLTKEPSRISLREILRVVEGSLCLVDCVDNPSVCKQSSTCITREVWSEVSKSLQNIFKNITLEKLVKKQKRKSH
jgi:Rrf2 family protein